MSARNFPTPTKQVFSTVHCKVPRCAVLHASHFCEVCYNEDSDHLSIDCPRPEYVGNPRVVYRGCSTLHCKVPRCAQLHARHYCERCGDENSDHLSIECPRFTSSAAPP